MNKQKEQFLIFRIRTSKDPDAFSIIYKEYFPMVRRYHAMKLPKNEIDDAIANTFERLWNYLKNVEKVDFLGALIRTIARGVIAEYYRNKERRPEEVQEETHSGSLFELIPDESTPAPDIRAEIALMRKKIDQMDNREYRTALVLRFVDGLEIADVAKQLDKSENATYVTIHRAIKALKKLYQD
ncbi:MAG: sigma-70 family RNA polymerase sigma factor [Patescibacteria group bacterium]